MELLNNPKNLDEKEFILRLKNGYLIEARYSYVSGAEKFLLFYFLQRTRNKIYPYVLTILEGREDADFQFGYCTEREAKIEFKSIEKAIAYLKKYENFNISDWAFGKIGKKYFEKKNSK